MKWAAKTVTDPKRGCGWRKPGGLYLIGEGTAAPCCALPIPLSVCPTCGQGIKPSRGWTWFDVDKLTEEIECTGSRWCPLGRGDHGMVGLLWIGEAYYKRAEDFNAEADQYGISRRVAALPRGFEVGKTWVALAHRHPGPHIFRLFRPSEVQFVRSVSDGRKSESVTVSQADLEDFRKRGITVVDVIKAGQEELPGMDATRAA